MRIRRSSKGNNVFNKFVIITLAIACFLYYFYLQKKLLPLFFSIKSPAMKNKKSLLNRIIIFIEYYWSEIFLDEEKREFERLKRYISSWNKVNLFVRVLSDFSMQLISPSYGKEFFISGNLNIHSSWILLHPWFKKLYVFISINNIHWKMVSLSQSFL